jgi:CMP-N,N'-diacetyllegionaminic acid synthase
MQPKVLAFIPARGGSKTIPKKNIAMLGGKPLLSYVIEACKDTQRVTEIVCSTDCPQISDVALRYGAEIHKRPFELAQDNSSVIDAVLSYGRIAEYDYVVLAQPTSPFLRASHIESALDILDQDSSMANCQTISLVPHNHHAINQRVVTESRYVEFVSREERMRAYNKQMKSRNYVFGNVIVSRVSSLLSTHDFFGSPCGYTEIEWPYNIDVDNQHDLDLANAVLKYGLVD